MRTLSTLALLAAIAAASVVHAQSSSTVALTEVSCNDNADKTAHVAWPADDPAWEFDITRPGASDSGTYPNGFGLEVSNVTYLGRKVFERAHVPVLNVEYDPGAGCSCYRDWQDSEAGIATTGALTGAQSCLALADANTVRTTCEATAGGDPGTFDGVAIEDYGDELVLTGNMRAGWYRYRIKWHFYKDGRIWPEYSFSAASATCTQAAHRHHAYWRFDFDLEGTPTNDIVREFSATDEEGTIFTNEADRTWGAPDDGVYWSVVDGDSQRGYEIVPDEVDLELPVDDFSKTDALILKYKVAELDDGITIGSGCAFEYDNQNWVDNESIENEDVVFWYRSSALHTAGNPWECDIVGPRLNPVNYAVAGQDGPATLAMQAVEVQAAVPNPTATATSVRFRVATEQTVRATLLDALGREVRVLFDGPIQAARYETVQIDATDLPAGTYVVRVEGETGAASTQISFVR